MIKSVVSFRVVQGQLSSVDGGMIEFNGLEQEDGSYVAAFSIFYQPGSSEHRWLKINETLAVGRQSYRLAAIRPGMRPHAPAEAALELIG